MLLHIVHIVLEIAMSIVLAVAAGYATHASIEITDKDTSEKSAYSILIASSVIGWVTIGVAVLSFIAMIVFPEEIMASSFLRKAIGSVMYLVCFATLLIGILMFYAGELIKRGADYGENKQAYTYAAQGGMIATVMSASVLLIYILFQAYEYYERKEHGYVQAPGAYGGGPSLAERNSKSRGLGGFSTADLVSTGIDLAMSAE